MGKVDLCRGLCERALMDQEAACKDLEGENTRLKQSKSSEVGWGPPGLHIPPTPLFHGQPALSAPLCWLSGPTGIQFTIFVNVSYPTTQLEFKSPLLSSTRWVHLSKHLYCYETTTHSQFQVACFIQSSLGFKPGLSLTQKPPCEAAIHHWWM